MTLTELRKQRAEHWERMKNFLNVHEQKDGTLSVDDTATYENMEAEMTRFNDAVERAEKAKAMEDSLDKPAAEPIVGKVGTTKADARETDEYKKEFLNYIRTHKASNTLQESISADGGYLVPTEFERALFAGRDAQDPIFEMAGRLFLGALEKTVPYVAEEGEAEFIEEGGAYPESDDSFGQVAFHAYKVGRIVKATEELIADSVFDIEAYLAGSLGKAIGKAEARKFWTGSGTGEPLGVMNCAGTGVTTAGNKPTADEVIDTYYSLPEQYRSVGYWAMNDLTVRDVRKLKTGEGQYLWAAGLNGAPDTILGRPLRTSRYIDTADAGKSIVAFGDFLGCYKIADRQGFEFKVLDQLYAANGKIGFRGGARTDGRGILANEGIKLMKIKA